MRCPCTDLSSPRSSCLGVSLPPCEGASQSISCGYGNFDAPLCGCAWLPHVRFAWILQCPSGIFSWQIPYWKVVGNYDASTMPVGPDLINRSVQCGSLCGPFCLAFARLCLMTNSQIWPFWHACEQASGVFYYTCWWLEGRRTESSFYGPQRYVQPDL